MMEPVKHKLTLDRPATYAIQVPGHLDEGWTEWNGALRIAAATTPDGTAVTTLTGTVDQAALQGILRRLYALGLPLISVSCLDRDPTTGPYAPA